MKKLFVFLFAGLMMLCIQVAVPVSTAEAAPLIKIADCGNVDGWPAAWYVDKGSYVIGGAITNPKLRVNIYKENENENIEARKYQFTKRNGQWVYYYQSWDGKGRQLRDVGWKPVSSNKMANDVLYVILN